jgi:3-deoxy-D-manno-octulosonate 8-phosphate phosphatase (KDO 8-P phosphatase)
MQYPQVLTAITTFIFDVDGVLTNGQVIVQENGEQTRIMNIKDGFALQLAVKLGYKVIIISGGKSEAVKTRLQRLGIHDVYLNAADKADVFDQVKITYDLKNEEIAYMGDDIPDYPVMKDVALPCCPSDAATEILDVSKYISDKKGGEGAGRDIIEKVLRSQKKWFNQGDNSNNNSSVLW